MKRTYEYDPPFTDFASVAQLSGLQLLQRIVAKELPPPPITHTLGFGLVEVAHGLAVFEGTTADYLYNPLGSVHGGWTSTLLDSAMACAVHSTLAPGQLYTTLDLQVRFVRALVAGTGVVRAEGKIVHAGKRIATAEGRLVGADGKLYATATTSCIIIS
jgi:uncharacterized protein (TIGR00369 family)